MIKSYYIRYSSIIRKTINAIGLFLGLVALIFVGKKLYELRQGLPELSVTLGLAVFIFIILYLFLYSFLASAWFNILNGLNVGLNFRLAFVIYGLSQLARYIPGNIFHLAGRQILGMRAGSSAVKLGKSIFIEHLILAMVGACFLPCLLGDISLKIKFLLVILLFGIVLYAIFTFIGTDSTIAAIKYFVFYLGQGVIFTTALEILLLEPIFSITFLGYCITGYAVGFLVGLITPGSPSGLGVREAVVYYLLKEYVGHDDLLAAAIIVRVSNMMGDVVFYIIAWSLQRSFKDTTCCL